MAVSVTQKFRTVPGAALRTRSIIGGDASYPTGGYTITPQMLGFTSQINELIGYDPANFASAAVVPVLTPTYAADGVTITSLQFQLQQYATAAEVAAATNVSAYTFIVVAEGR